MKLFSYANSVLELPGAIEIPVPARACHAAARNIAATVPAVLFTQD